MNPFSCSFVSWPNSAELLIFPPGRLFVPPVAIPLLWFPIGGGFVCLIRLRLFVPSSLCMSDCRYSIGSRVILSFHHRRRRHHHQPHHHLAPVRMGFNHAHSEWILRLSIHGLSRLTVPRIHPAVNSLIPHSTQPSFPCFPSNDVTGWTLVVLFVLVVILDTHLWSCKQEQFFCNSHDDYFGDKDSDDDSHDDDDDDDYDDGD